MAPAQPSSSREADHAEPRVDAGSAHRREQFCSLSFKLQPRVLMRAIPGHSIDALHEIEDRRWRMRSEEHTSELQSLMRISYAVFWLKTTSKKDISTLSYALKRKTSAIIYIRFHNTLLSISKNKTHS